MIIALDGPAGSGKSTIAKRLSEILNISYISSGLIYRAFAYFLLKNKANEEKALEYLDEFREKLIFTMEGENQILPMLEDEILTDEKLHEHEISLLTPKVAKIPQVREVLTEIFREKLSGFSFIMDGRDVGTVIFPNAKFKFFIDAKPEERAKRRWLQLDKKVEYEKILEEIKKRDELDRNREVAPLKPAVDAVIIDTSDLTVDEVVEKILQVVRGK